MHHPLFLVHTTCKRQANLYDIDHIRSTVANVLYAKQSRRRRSESIFFCLIVSKSGITMTRLMARQFIFILIVQFFASSFCRKNSTSPVNQKLTVCSNSAIKVTNVTLLCDSPGTYYYGSGKYRNSPSCLPGDKAKVDLNFYITQDLSSGNNGQNSVLLTIQAEGGNGNLYSYTVYWNAPICALGTLTKLNETNYLCPSVGAYEVSTQFYWGESGSTDQSSFYPIVSVGFRSNKNQEKFDLGGANTDLCPGKSETYISWSKYVQPVSAGESASILWCVGVLLGTITVLGAFMFFLRRKQCNQWCYSGDDDPLLEVVEDNKKMQLFRSNRMLVDF